MTVCPNAKINIGLNIRARLSNGYHEIATLMYPIPLADTLTIEQAGRPEFVQDGALLPDDGRPNLVLRAVEAVARLYPLPPLSIRLTKVIPSGAGLGGGSADAAFTIATLNRMFSLGLTDSRMCAIADTLGKDCPFFILNRPAIATGLGEQLAPSRVRLAGMHLLLVKPEVHISTQQAYRGCAPEPWPEPVERLTELPIEQWRDVVKNDFETTLFPHYPNLEQIKAHLYDAGALYASMSGSGSAIYGIFRDNEGLDRAKHLLSAEKQFAMKLG